MVNSNVSACRLLVHQVPIRNMRDLLFMEWSLLFNTGSKIYTGFQTCLAKVLKCFASNVLKGHHNSAFQVFHDFKWAVIFMCTCISPRRRLSLAFDSDFGTFTQIGVLANATVELVSTGLLWRNQACCVYSNCLLIILLVSPSSCWDRWKQFLRLFFSKESRIHVKVIPFPKKCLIICRQLRYIMPCSLSSSSIFPF